ncbi:MAG: polysaccharide deacetylase family protein [Pseudomonadota bacterium]
MGRLALILMAALVVAGCQSAAPGTTVSSPTVAALQRPQAVATAAPQRQKSQKRSTQRKRARGKTRRHTAGTCVRAVAGASSLTGRTITVRSAGDIKLRRREVVLTFDDGPAPGRTNRILTALGNYGVRATFFVVGRAAKAYPSLLKRVAREGHTVAHHTYSHPNLRKLSHGRALAEVSRGERAVARALSGSGLAAANFFRFPYLADSRVLRSAIRSRGSVIIDVDIDSKDYFKTSGSRVLARTMARLRKRGRGIILFHDIHARTASMLPDLLATLRREGYKVVHLRAPGASACPGATS